MIERKICAGCGHNLPISYFDNGTENCYLCFIPPSDKVEVTAGKRKTAMQMLMDWYIDTPPSTRYACMEEKIKRLMKDERQQIIDAFDDGQANYTAPRDYSDGNEYFQTDFSNQ